MPKVSVIIPVYNVEEYLVECLESVINQTEKDLEIICVEDCSTDSSLKILQEYAKKDERIIILQNEVNSGLSVTRNNGLAIAKGEYILFVDSDDFIVPNLLEKTINLSNGVDFVLFDYSSFNENKMAFENEESLLPDGFFTSNDYFLKAVCQNCLKLAPCDKLYRTDFLKENNIMFIPGIVYEDILFTFFCMLKAKNVYCINEKLYVYRKRANSIMTSELSEKNIKDHFFSLYEASSVFVESDFSEETNVVIEKFIQRILRDYIRFYRKYFFQNTELFNKIAQDNTKQTKLQRVFSNALIGITDYTLILNEKLGYLKNKDNIVVYGAGDIAREVISCLDLNDISIAGIAVSDTKNNRKSLMGNPVRELSDYENIKDDCLVIIAVSSRFSVEIKELLEKSGFTRYIELF